MHAQKIIVTWQAQRDHGATKNKVKLVLCCAVMCSAVLYSTVLAVLCAVLCCALLYVRTAATARSGSDAVLLPATSERTVGLSAMLLPFCCSWIRRDKSESGVVTPNHILNPNPNVTS